MTIIFTVLEPESITTTQIYVADIRQKVKSKKEDEQGEKEK